MNECLLMVEWMDKKIIRCIELTGIARLSGPDWHKTAYNYWYDRRRGRVCFRAGLIRRQKKGNAQDWDQYLTDMDEVRPLFSYAVYIQLSGLDEQQEANRREQRGAYQNQEASPEGMTLGQSFHRDERFE